MHTLTMDVKYLVFVTILTNAVGHFVKALGESNTTFVSHISKDVELSHILPIKWRTFCHAEYRLLAGDHFTPQNAFIISCDLQLGDNWLLTDYRKWISANEDLIYKYLPMKSNLKVAVDLKCRNIETTVSLPWPMLAEHLWYISAQHCTITDHFSEFNVVHNVENVLKVINIQDCIRQVKLAMMFESMSNYLNQSREYDCGGENVEKHVIRNVTLTFKELSLPTSVVGSDSNSSESMSKSREVTARDSSDGQTLGDKRPVQPFNVASMNEEFVIENMKRVGQENQKLENKCNFRYLKYMDESYSYAVSKHIGHFMVERKHYPVLEYYNMSHSKLREITPMLLQWRRYFPKMKYVDLSHNRIKYFKTFFDNGLRDDKPGIFDLRHNNITTLTSDDLITLRVHSRSVFVDIRDNPYFCDCKLQHLLPTLQNASSEVLLKYQYLLNLKCAGPPKHRGKIISMLENDFCKTLAFVILSAPFIALSCVCILTFIVFILSVRYRKEIVILAFTRLHISLPCRHINKAASKKYDAFIAYSEHDSSWVFQTMLPKLEEPTENNGPGLKLCIHHRDFPVGGCIADNILDKITDSHHTVLILSNNFLLSHWCKYEFKTAFTQSLMEKKQHLIMVLVEDLNKRLIDADLKRCLKTFTYVKIDDRLLWDKLIYALSDNKRKTNVDINFNSCKTSVTSVNRVSVKTLSNGTRSTSHAAITSISKSLETSEESESLGMDQKQAITNNVTPRSETDNGSVVSSGSMSGNVKGSLNTNSDTVNISKCPETVVKSGGRGNGCQSNGYINGIVDYNLYTNMGLDDRDHCALNMSTIETDLGVV